MKRILYSIFVLIMACLLCGSIAAGEVSSPDASGETLPLNRRISIQPDEAVVYVGKVLKLKAEVFRNTEDAPKKTKLVWASSDPAVASVSKDGSVKGIIPGDAVISVSAADDGAIQAHIPVSVRVSVSKLTTAEPAITLFVGPDDAYARGRIQVSVLPDNAYDPSVTFVSSNPAVAEVDSEGNLQAVSEGKAVITVKSNDASLSKPKTVQCKVTVLEAAGSIELEQDSLAVYAGKTVQIIASAVTPKGKQKKIRYVSSDESIAAVSQKGLVKGKKNGTCTIQCIVADEPQTEASIKVRVRQPVTGIALTGIMADFNSKSTLYLHRGETWMIRFDVLPSGYTYDESVSWTSGDPSIAEVTLTDNRIIEIKSNGGEGETKIVGVSDSNNKVKFPIRILVEPGMPLKCLDLRGYTDQGGRCFVYQFRNVSEIKTVDSVTVKYWAEDENHNRLKVNGSEVDEVEETLSVTVGPGKTAKTEKFYANGFSEARYIYVDLVKVHFKNGEGAMNTTGDFAKCFTY